MYKSIKYLAAIFITGLALNACKKDYANPAATQFEDALHSSVGLTGISLGVQKQYSVGGASSLYTLVTANGFLTNELRLMNAGNVSEFNLSVGGNNVDGNNAVVENMWTNSMKVIFDANNVITNAGNLGDKSYAAGLIGYATIFKALAYGNLSMFWQQVPDTLGNHVSFIDRKQGFSKALAAINSAIATISANPISPSFLSALPGGIEIPNTLRALKARYLLFLEDYDGALAAANEVDLSVTSTLNFDAISPNPIFSLVTATNNVYQVLDSTFGLPPALAPDVDDKRIPFYMSINETVAPRWRIKGFASSISSPWPVYLPGEMTLIKAESYARRNTPDLGAAVTEINKIRQKSSASDPLGVGAELPAYSGPVNAADVLTEIYRERCIELYMSGLKLEDSRRFGRPVGEKKRNFFPYPFRERDNNPNTPADPDF